MCKYHVIIYAWLIIIVECLKSIEDRIFPPVLKDKAKEWLKSVCKELNCWSDIENFSWENVIV